MNRINREDYAALAPPPANVDAEVALLGVILMAPAKYDQVAGMLRPADFYAEQNAVVFSGIERMLERGLDLDSITLVDYLRAHQQLDQAGGEQYVHMLPVHAPCVRDIHGYAKVITNHSLERRMLTAADDIREIVHSPGEPMDKLTQAQTRILDVAPNMRGTGPTLLSEAMVDVMREVGTRVRDGRPVGLPTGFADIDRHAGGLREGNLIIVASRPSMGKTALALQIGEYVAVHEKKTAVVFSLEMSTGELVERMLSGVSGVDHERIRDGLLTDEDGPKIEHATEILDTSSLVIDDTPGISVIEIGARLRTIKRQRGLALVVIDYLQLMPGRGSNRNEEMGSITRSLKGLAKELKVPIVLLSQLSRKCEERTDKRPMLSDLRESGEIEQDADVVVMLYRDDYYNPDSQAAGTCEVIFRKFRNGRPGTRRLVFLPNLVRFGNYLGGNAPIVPQKESAPTYRRKKVEIPY